MSGAEIQANIIATLVDSAYITAPRWLWMPPILIVVGGLLGVAYARLNLGWAALLMVAINSAGGPPASRRSRTPTGGSRWSP